MSYRTIEEYEREMWEQRVYKGVKALVDAANGEHTWYPAAEVMPFRHEFFGESEEPYPGRVDRPDSFRVGMSYVLYNTLKTPEEAILRLTKDIVDKFQTDKRWETARPRLHFCLLTGPRFEILVSDDSY